MPVQVAAVLEDLVAQGAAVNPLVLSEFVPLDDRQPLWTTQQAVLCCREQLGPLRQQLHICTHSESNTSLLYFQQPINKTILTVLRFILLKSGYPNPLD